MNQRKSQEGESGLFLVETWNFLFFYPFVKLVFCYRFSVQVKLGGGVCARAWSSWVCFHLDTSIVITTKQAKPLNLLQPFLRDWGTHLCLLAPLSSCASKCDTFFKLRSASLVGDWTSCQLCSRKFVVADCSAWGEHSKMALSAMVDVTWWL